MNLLIRCVTTDALSIEFLEEAKRYKKMGSIVSDAIAHYCRTPEGKRSLKLLKGDTGRPKVINANRTPVKKQVDLKHDIIPNSVMQQRQPVTVSDFLSITKK